MLFGLMLRTGLRIGSALGLDVEDVDFGRGELRLRKAKGDREGIEKNANVYAELGSTWRTLMRDPEAAAHVIGKLVTQLGEKNVIYGSDCIWYGSPQDQILAMRSFQISEEFQERYGYPKITPALRAGILGLNATRPYGIAAEEVLRRAKGDAIERRRADYRERPDPHFRTYGPKTRREFLENLRARGGSPV